jgi:ketosteroid isomerase-like protein
LGSACTLEEESDARFVGGHRADFTVRSSGEGAGFLQTRRGGRPLAGIGEPWNHAEQSKDAVALNQLLGESLVYVDCDGTLLSKKEFLETTLHNNVQQEQINNDGMTVHLYGNAAVVTGVYRDRGIEKGKPFQRHGRFTDTWVNQNGVWQCVASQSTLITH